MDFLNNQDGVPEGTYRVISHSGVTYWTGYFHDPDKQLTMNLGQTFVILASDARNPYYVHTVGNNSVRCFGAYLAGIMEVIHIPLKAFRDLGGRPQLELVAKEEADGSGSY